MTNAKKSVIMENAEKKPITLITDEIVDKVPYIQIVGYTNEQCAKIQEQHKELLTYSRDNNNCNEVAFVLKSDMSRGEPIKGSDDKIEFSELYGTDLTVLHNHPRNNSFSYNDLYFFYKNDQVRTMTIVKNNGTVEYITKSNNFDEKIFDLEMSRMKKKILKSGNDNDVLNFGKKFLSKSKSGVIWSGQY